MKKILFSFITLLVAFAASSQTVGLITKDQAAEDGYVLFSPINSKTTFLIDKCGYVVHQWDCNYMCGLSAYLNDDGTLVRPGILDGNPVFSVPGHGGIIQKLDWDGNLLWSFKISTDTDMQHHDIVPLPNGNVLALCYEYVSPQQAIAMGKDSAVLDTGTLWVEKILEIHPTGDTTGTVVWEWHMRDHLIQDINPAKGNYGNVAQHPELLDINYIGGTIAGQIVSADWLHCNALAYNPALDQIILNSRNLSEMWFIDHSTTSAQAAAHSGGRYGKGGDFLYRWGNPAIYRAATASTERLYGEHSPNWIDGGLAGAGDILLFNNGVGRPAGNFSTVEEFTPPMDSAGNYSLVPNHAYLPDSSNWKYTATPPTSLFSPRISGAQRLPNGNTLICEGDSGIFYEIDPMKNIVWKYVNPVMQNGNIAAQGTRPDTNNIVFRCKFLPFNFPAFNGRTLTPGQPIERNPIQYTCSNVPTAIRQPSEIINIKAVNPFTNQIMVEAGFTIENADVTLTDVSGSIVASFGKTSLIANYPYTFELHNTLAPGFYLLRLHTQQQNAIIKLVHL